MKEDSLIPETSVIDPKLLTLPIKRLDGTLTGETIILPAEVFGIVPKSHVIYSVIKAELTNRRQGTHSTRTRGEVSGGGRKPWRQKGLGRARAGSIRSPLWRHGGTIHGPKPREYQEEPPIKVKRLARRMALTAKAIAGGIQVVEEFEMEAPKTRQVAGILKSLGINGHSALLLVGGYKPTIVKSGRNIPRFEVREARVASTYDIMKAQHLILTPSAVVELQGVLGR